MAGNAALLNIWIINKYGGETCFININDLQTIQGNMGVMMITNIRIVWYALSNSIYNVSIPYFQIVSWSLWFLLITDNFYNEFIIIIIVALAKNNSVLKEIDEIEGLKIWIGHSFWNYWAGNSCNSLDDELKFTIIISASYF